jgi:hypothetical protein
MTERTVRRVRKNETPEQKTEREAADRRDKAPLTGVVSLHDVVRHVAQYGPARNDAERDELVGAVNEDDPDYTEPASDDDEYEDAE